MFLFVSRVISSFRRQPYQIIRKFSAIPLADIRDTIESVSEEGKSSMGLLHLSMLIQRQSAWHTILQLIQRQVQSSLEYSLPPGEERTELLEAHNLVIHDDPEKFNGATSHEVRDHFHGWVAEQLPKVVDTPETLERIFEAYSKQEDPIVGPEYGFGARYNLALFVDDICLESLVHMRHPVVKIMYKQWADLRPEERNYKIHPDWHDGTTEDGDEDVGWIYTSVIEYIDTYDRFEQVNMAIWHDECFRPPCMLDYSYDEEREPGFWRK